MFLNEINKIEKKTNQLIQNIEINLESIDFIGTITLKQLQQNINQIDIIVKDITIIVKKLKTSTYLQNKFSFINSCVCLRQKKDKNDKINQTIQKISNSLNKIKNISNLMQLEVDIQNNKLHYLDKSTQQVVYLYQSQIKEELLKCIKQLE